MKTNLPHCLAFLLSTMLAAASVLASAAERSVQHATGPGALPSYESVPGATGEIEFSVTDETIALSSMLIDDLESRQPGLLFRLRPISETVAGTWWTRSPSMQAAVLARPMTNSETESYRLAKGHDPLMLRIAADRLAVIVHASNPRGDGRISVRQLDALFSRQRLRGHPLLQSWGQLGLEGEWADRPVKPVAQVGTTAISTHFRERVLKGADLRLGIPRLESAARVIERVREDKNAIGYVPRSQLDAGVTTLEIDGWDIYPEEPASGYGLSAYWIYLYVDHEPGKRLKASLQALVHYFTSRQAQQLVEKAGYLPLSRKTVDSDLDKFRAERRKISTDAHRNKLIKGVKGAALKSF